MGGIGRIAFKVLPLIADVLLFGVSDVPLSVVWLLWGGELCSLSSLRAPPARSPGVCIPPLSGADGQPDLNVVKRWDGSLAERGPWQGQQPT